MLGWLSGFVFVVSDHMITAFTEHEASRCPDATSSPEADESEHLAVVTVLSYSR